MKIFKKIGIGCLALIICFCSCFKFVNAYTIYSDDTLYEDSTYYIYIDNNGGIDFSDNTFAYVEIYGNSYTLSFDGSMNIIVVTGDSDYEWDLTFVGYYEIDNPTGITYTVYSFQPTVTTVLIDYEYTPSQLFIETNNFVSNNSVYHSVYDIVSTYIFGGKVLPNSYQELTTTMLSGIICIFIFALPFLIVWKVIKIIVG